MPKYRCKICGYTYDPAVGDPDGGIKPGTSFEQLPCRLAVSDLRRRQDGIRKGRLAFRRRDDQARKAHQDAP